MIVRMYQLFFVFFVKANPCEPSPKMPENMFRLYFANTNHFMIGDRQALATIILKMLFLEKIPEKLGLIISHIRRGNKNS